MREVVLLRGSNGLSELREPTDGGVRGAFISGLQEERCDGVTTLFHPGFCKGGCDERGGSRMPFGQRKSLSDA